MKNLFTRALSGAVYVALICTAVILGGWWFIGLFAIFSALAISEFSRLSNSLTGGENTTTLVIDIAGGLILTIGLACVNMQLFTPLTTKLIGGTLFTLYLLYLIVRLVSQIYTREASPLVNLAFSYMSQIYIALPLGLMSMYYTLPAGTPLLLAMFIMIWLSDTGAYLVGSMIGRHKLIPRISPGKTWEGFIGGVCFAMGSAFVMKLCFPSVYSAIPLLGLVGLGFVVAIFATWGDLVESLIKRTLGVKDSGNIMPGHGGILDRIDSLLLVIPASLLYLITLFIYI
ncbi:MAG: phosphatidate cytidylyltransferase [Muribaculaceae bacterium]|nr:phosphatidate cytidylyltransferase [Muribaculaceae bacterium]